MPNHRHMRAAIVPKGTAPDEPAFHTKKLSANPQVNTSPGMSSAVPMATDFHESRPSDLDSRPVAYLWPVGHAAPRGARRRRGRRTLR